MPAYQVVLSKAARKRLTTLPVFIHNKIIEDITLLSEAPRPAGCKKLKGQKKCMADQGRRLQSYLRNGR